MAFLCEKILEEFGKRALAQKVVPNYIFDNLKPVFGQRPYQIESFLPLLVAHYSATPLLVLCVGNRRGITNKMSLS